jgi:hypothetical protein
VALMRFFLDVDLSQVVAEILRRHGLDAVSVHEIAGREGLPDEEQLSWAAEVQRCLVTRNGDHFVGLTHSFVARGLAHTGVLIVPRSLRYRDFGGIARAIIAYAESHKGDMPTYMVDYLRPTSP